MAVTSNQTSVQQNDNLKRLREQYKASEAKTPAYDSPSFSVAKGATTRAWNRLYKAYQAVGYNIDKLIADLEKEA